MRVLSWVLLFSFLITMAFAQVGPGGVTPRGSIQGKNGGTPLGTALTVNCDGNCILCTLSGTTMTISFNSSCSSGPTTPTVTYLGVNVTYLGVPVLYLGK